MCGQREFKVCDSLWSLAYGWGVVQKVANELHYKYPVRVYFKSIGCSRWYSHSGVEMDASIVTLFDREMELVPARPKAPPKGTIVVVRNLTTQHWVVRVSAGVFNEDGLLLCYTDGRMSGDTAKWDMFEVYDNTNKWLIRYD